MEIKVVLVDAFTAKAGGGNPAGVVEYVEGLSPEQMLFIAKEIGFSETAFVSPSKIADYKVRFFTPSDEVDLCGHATIATFAHLFKSGKIKAGQHTQETGAGVLTVEVKENGDVFMEQSLPVFSEIVPKEKIAESLGILPEAISGSFPIEIVSTGLRDMIVPIKSLADLKSIKPDFEMIKNISKDHDAVGYHVFTLETENNGTAQCRNFAPLYDIPEESATGTSNGALACYLWKHGKGLVKSDQVLTFEQGYTMGRPSEIKGIVKVDFSDKKEQIEKILIGGKAVIWGEKTIKLGENN